MATISCLGISVYRLWISKLVFLRMHICSVQQKIRKVSNFSLFPTSTLGFRVCQTFLAHFVFPFLLIYYWRSPRELSDRFNQMRAWELERELWFFKSYLLFIIHLLIIKTKDRHFKVPIYFVHDPSFSLMRFEKFLFLNLMSLQE